MPLSDFNTPTDWAHDLDTRWPERSEMRSLLAGTIAARFESHAGSPAILELGVGDGEVLMTLGRALPNARLHGLDVNPQLIDFVRGRLDDNVELIEQDLCDSAWSSAIGVSFDAIYSLQSFHDLGGREMLSATYEQILSALMPGGVLINADFIVPMPHDDPDNPRRFAVEEHLSILRSLGFEEASLLGRVGMLGCVAAYKRP